MVRVVIVQKRRHPVRMALSYRDVRLAAETYDYAVERCGFYEAFSAFGMPWLTVAFCTADEVVFNELNPRIHFRRLPILPNTIARGGSACSFHFEDEQPAPP